MSEGRVKIRPLLGSARDRELGLKPKEGKEAARSLQIGNTASLGKPDAYMRMHEPSPHATRHVPEYMCQECMYTGVHVPDAYTRV